MATELDTRQSVNRPTLSTLGTTTNTQLDTILGKINTELDIPLRLAASFPTPDALLHVRASKITAADGAEKSATPISSTVTSFVDSTINFQTGVTTGGSFVPGGVNTITLPSSTVGNYRRAGFTLLADGSVQVLFSAESVTLIGLANPGTLFSNGGLPIGWIDLQATAATAYKTANSSTSIIENAPGGTPAIHRFGSGSGSGGSSSSNAGGEDDVLSVAYNAKFSDDFRDIPSLTGPVDINTGLTDSTLYSVTNQYYRLSYDATRTVTGTGTSMTLSGTPTFTVKVGDILRVGTEARRITVVTTQVLYTIESAFATNPTAAAATVSQAVYTVDLNGFAGSGVAVSSLFSDSIGSVLLTYEDTLTVDDIIPDTGTPNVAATVSSDGTTYSSVYARTNLITDELQELGLSTSSTQLKIRFFSNKTTGSGAVNLLGYKVFYHRQDLGDTVGGALNTAYCFTDGTGTEINCQPPTVVSSKTRIILNFNYTRLVNPGTTNGQLEVYINGQKIPRFVDGTITPDAYYTEVNNNTIDLDSDYSALNYSVDIVQPVAIVDYSSSNRISIQTRFAPYDMENYSITATVAANALTIALKTRTGNDPSALDPVNFSYRDATATNGAFNAVALTGPLALTISSGSTLGQFSGVDEYINVYLIINSSSVSFAVITDNTNIDEGSLQSSTAEGGAGAADNRYTIYSPTSLVSKPVRLLARIKTNQVAAGTWAAAPTEISLLPFKTPRDKQYQISSSSGVFSTGSAAYVDVTNLSVTITTTGRPVVLQLINDGTASQTVGYNPAGSGSGFFAFDRGGANIAEYILTNGTPTPDLIFIPGSAIAHLDAVAAGTYTYKLRVKVGSGTLVVNGQKLTAYEI